MSGKPEGLPYASNVFVVCVSSWGKPEGLPSCVFDTCSDQLVPFAPRLIPSTTMAGFLLAFVRVIIGLVSLTAGTLKLIQRSDATAGFSKLLGISPAASRLLTFALAIVEVTVGASLLSGIFLSVVLPVAAVMFGGFGVMVLVLLQRGRAGRSCGCFGNKGRIGGALAAQDFGLMLLALGLWLNGLGDPVSYWVLWARPGLLSTFVIAIGSLLFLAPSARRLWSSWQARGIRLEHATEPAQR